MPNIPSYLLYGLQNSMNLGSIGATGAIGNCATLPVGQTLNGTNLTTEEAQRQFLSNLNPFLLQHLNQVTANSTTNNPIISNASSSGNAGRLFPIKNKKEENELTTKQQQQKKKIKPKIKDINEVKEITKIFSESVLDSIVDKEVDKILDDFILKFSTNKSIELHEIDEIKQQDKIRKEIISQWENIEEKQNWRLSWLNIRIEQLNNELIETNEKLENLNKEKEEITIETTTRNIKNNILTLEEYPPQIRAEEIKNHPLFSNFNITNNTKFLKEDVINSLKILTTGLFFSFFIFFSKTFKRLSFRKEKETKFNNFNRKFFFKFW